jgi:hypothetical protein
MTDKEKRMAAMLLKIAAEKFSDHGCNDLDREFIRAADLTDEEKVALVTELVAWNGDPDRYGGSEITPDRFDCLMNFELMSFLAHKLRSKGSHVVIGMKVEE